jgi:hypothetical protein
MAIHRRGGILSFNIDGQVYEAKGNFTYNLGYPLREEVIGADGVHGYKETHQASYIEGEFTDSVNVDLAALVNISDVTVTLSLGNGKAIVLRQAWYSGDGNVQTEEGNITVKFTSRFPADEIQ